MHATRPDNPVILALVALILLPTLNYQALYYTVFSVLVLLLPYYVQIFSLDFPRRDRTFHKFRVSF